MNQPAIETLERLRQKIRVLHSYPRLGLEFQAWHEQVLQALDKIFGPSSAEKDEFEKLSFEVRPEFVEQIQDVLGERFGSLAGCQISIPDDFYYSRQLYEAEQMLLAFIILLRSGKAPR